MIPETTSCNAISARELWGGNEPEGGGLMRKALTCSSVYTGITAQLTLNGNRSDIGLGLTTCS